MVTTEVPVFKPRTFRKLKDFRQSGAQHKPLVFVGWSVDRVLHRKQLAEFAVGAVSNTPLSRIAELVYHLYQASVLRFKDIEQQFFLFLQLPFARQVCRHRQAFA